jgi:hypothetical protein
MPLREDFGTTLRKSLISFQDRSAPDLLRGIDMAEPERRIPELDARLSRAIDAQFEPTWDRDRGEFTWGLGLVLARALWIDDVLHVRLDVRRSDPAVLTSFRILDAEPHRAWSVVGGERSTIERDGNSLVVTTPMPSGDLRIEPLR